MLPKIGNDNFNLRFKFLLLFLILLYASDSSAEMDLHSFIGNGTFTTDFTPVVRLNLISPEGRSINCTGTQIDTGIILFSAHCICEDFLISKVDPSGSFENGQNYIMVNAQKANHIKIRVHPNYSCQMAKVTPINLPQNDLAMIKIPKAENEDLLESLKQLGTFQIAKTRPILNEKVTLVGYGFTSGDHKFGGRNQDHRKYFGTNKIVGITHWHLLVEYDRRFPNAEENASGLSGDSGGPLLNKNQEVVGVLSGGSPCHSLKLNKDKIFYTPLYTRRNIKFLLGVGNWKE